MPMSRLPAEPAEQQRCCEHCFSHLVVDKCDPQEPDQQSKCDDLLVQTCLGRHSRGETRSRCWLTPASHKPCLAWYGPCVCLSCWPQHEPNGPEHLVGSPRCVEAAWSQEEL